MTELCRICGADAVQRRADVSDRRYRHCAHCHGICLDAGALPDPAEERAIYDLHENDPADERYRRFVARLADPMIARLPPGAAGLDYGSGDGPAGAALLREAGFDVTCYDPMYQPDAAALGRCYDFIFCCEVAEHFHHPAVEFGRLARLLHPGGLLGVMTAMAYPQIDFARWHYRRDPTHVAFYAPETLAVLARRHGWALELPADNVALFTAPA